MGHYARGSLWLSSSSFVVLGLSVASQVVLGWLLNESDFGVFAVALGLTALLEAFRDGGVGHWLLSKPREDLTDSIARSFWVAVGFSLIIAGLLAGAAPLAGRIYGDPEVSRIVLVIAISLPLSAYGAVYSAKLSVDMRFRAMAAISIGIAVVRTSLAVALALAGFGPQSLALPLVAGNLFSVVAGYRMTGLVPWHFRLPRATDVRDVVRESGWAMAGTLSISLAERADYAVLGLVISAPAVGLYYFAYQLPYRLAIAFFGETARVVIRILVQVREAPARFSRVVARGSGLVGVFASPLFLALAITAPDIEAIVWRGRWAEAVPPAQIFAALFPFDILERYGSAILRSLGAFRKWSFLGVGRGIGLGVTALVAGISFGDDVKLLAAVVGIYLAATGVLSFVVAIKTSGGRVGASLREFLLPYIWSASAAAAAYIVAERLHATPGLGRLVLVGFVFSSLMAIIGVQFRGRLVDALELLRSVRR